MEIQDVLTIARGPKLKTRAPSEAQPKPPTDVDDSARAYVRDLGRHFAVTSVKHVAEGDIKDGLRRALAGQHAAIETFIEAKLAEGYSLKEINEYSAIHLQVMPSIVDRKIRIEVEWPFEIISPDD